MAISSGTMKPAISTRPARANEAAAIAELVHLAYRGGLSTVEWKNESHLVEGPRISTPQVEELIAATDKQLVVAETENPGDRQVVGCVLVEKDDEAAHIGLLAVHPSCQDIGLGRQLLQSAEKVAREHFSCTAAVMGVLTGRPELLAWYKRCGYEETGATDTVPFAETGQKPRDANAHLRVIRKTL